MPLKIGNSIKLCNAALMAGLKTILNVFSQAPVYKSGAWYYEDASGNSNDNKVINTPVVNFYSTLGHHMKITNLYAVGGDAINVDFIIKTGTATTNQTIFSTGAATSAAKGCYLHYNSGSWAFASANGTSTVTTYFSNQPSISNNTIYVCEFRWDGTGTTPPTLRINGTLCTGQNNSQTWSGNSANVFEIGSNQLGNSRKFVGLMSYFKLQGKAEYCFQERQGLTIYDSLGLNNALLVNMTEATFYSQTLNLEPYSLTKGATVYNKTADNSKLIICFDTSQSISGFTKITYFPPDSGLLLSLISSVNVPVNSDLNLVIPAGDYTCQELAALVNSRYLVKTQNDNVISRMVVKKKIIDLIVNFNNLTTYNNLTKY